MASYRWTCDCCGQQFDSLPTCWSVGPPTPYQALSDEDRAKRAVINSDSCLIDDQLYIRGHIEIPIMDAGEPFAWSVWVSLSQQSTSVLERVWDDKDRVQHGPFFGWLCSNLPYEPTTVGLKTMVHLRAPGTTPFIEVEPTDHTLAVEQRSGVTLSRVAEFAGMFEMHRRLDR